MAGPGDLDREVSGRPAGETAGQPGTVALTVQHEGDVQAIAFSPDSTRFATGGGVAAVTPRGKSGGNQGKPVHRPG